MTTEFDAGLAEAIQKMTEAGVGASAIAAFRRFHSQLASGAVGIIAESDIEPLLDPVRRDELDVSADEASEALDKTVIIKLNGGLGTSMGLDGPKSLLTVRDGRTFLDVSVEQVMSCRRRTGARLPLLFMDSFRTQEPTLAALEAYPDLAVGDLPLSFLQSQEPKLRADDLSPVSWPADPSLEWCPPGHGDIYAALWDSGILKKLLCAGYEYAMVSNGDNLGAAPDATLAGWFAACGAEYAAEVCARNANDRKGGHLARRKSDGRLILRDTAQTAPEDQHFVEDPSVHPYFHTNNLWWNLAALASRLEANDGVLGLPLIRNQKTVDPTDPTSDKVIQVESAMGAAVEVFEDARAVLVGRDRFVPVKTTNELLILRSDLFELDDAGLLVAQVAELPSVVLGKPYAFEPEFTKRIPDAPSLRQANSLRVEGDWTFESDVTVIGDVALGAEGGVISAGTVLGGPGE